MFRAFSFLIALQRLIQNPGKAGDHHPLGSRAFERSDAGSAGRTAGEYVIDQQDLGSFKRRAVPGIDRNRARKDFGAGLFPGCCEPGQFLQLTRPTD